MSTKNKTEIMAPAGSWESLTAALKAGANSIYFGVEQLNMRSRAANNFKLAELPKIVKLCNKKNVKTYLTVNIVLYDHEEKLMKKIIDAAKDAGVTAVIAGDIAVIQYAHEVGMEIHISTQANISNIGAVKFFSQFADVVVLARELTLNQIKNISEEIKKQNIRGPKGNIVQIELFAHGALCVAISGKCHMSLATYNASANRGACLQNCRRSYRVIDEDTGEELILDNKYVMSPKDLCTIGFMDQLMSAGVTVFKLEGRGRSADYVETVVRIYRESADCVESGNYTKEKIETWTKDLESVFNRGFWHGGYYLGKQLGEWSGVYGSRATKENIFLGTATKYFAKSKIGEFQMETGTLTVGDDILITGPTTGALKLTIEEMYVDGKKSDQAKKGNLITIKTDTRIRKNDKLFVKRNKKI